MVDSVYSIEQVLDSITKKKDSSLITAGVPSFSYILSLLQVQKKQCVVIGQPQVLRQLTQYLSVFNPDYESQSAIFPAIEYYTKDSALFQIKLLHALYMLSYSHLNIVLIPYTQCICAFPAPSLFEHVTLELHKGMTLSYELLQTTIARYGYTTTSMVHRYGDVAYRGDIIDIYPPDAYCSTAKGGVESLPIRIELFGDTIEDIRIFNKENQRFIQKIEKHTLYPIHYGCVASPEEQEQYQKTLSSNDNPILRYVQERSISTAPSYLYQPTQQTLFDWLPKDALYCRLDEDSLEDSITKAKEQIQEYCEHIYESSSLVIDSSKFLSSYDIHSIIEKKVTVTVESLSTKTPNYTLHEKNLHTFQEICSTKEAFEKPWKTMIQTLQTWKNQYEQIILVFKTHRNRDAFIELAKEDGIAGFTQYTPKTKGIFFCIGELEKGSILSFANTIIVPEILLYPYYKAKKGSKKTFKGLQQHTALQEGSYIVHKEYGIGIYQGLHRIALAGIENDYLALEYANEDKVYIPVHNIGVLQIHNAVDEHVLLDSLGGSGWKNSIAKAKKAIEQIAHDLVAMYAQRSCALKYRYGPYTDLYREFEMAFGFEETPDQAKAIEDVLHDMDSEKPMDRLVCGDVGFGKTEVAIRACVRAALDGRQAIFLCPTTILAEQHYQTIQNRIAMLPLRVGLLSRFVSKHEQKKVLAGLEDATIDIVIGTHRLLSSDVRIPNVSLLVLDEEHRFGVRHKEKLKLLRNNIDTLTLTATPIPRTLQLSMSGIRELSIIETPPLERKPVETVLCEYGDSVIVEALYREIERGGQIFWVYNRVHSIEERQRYIQKLCPSARIGIVHGQMNESSLEKTMQSFWQGEIDVLLATTIIESGLDFPLANTIIIDSAHTFGLNQLYQLRGRIGRGDRQGYAYFVIPEKKALTEIAMDRLQAILSCDYLGAGFHLAMEDLRIRGAGNILGEAQSGHIERIGIDLYLEMLEEEVQKIRSHGRITKPIEQPHTVDIALSIPTYIPENYIADSKERLYYYRKLSMVQNNEEEEDIRTELQDRFGPLPEHIDNFLAVLSLQKILSVLGVAKAIVNEKTIIIKWKEGQNIVDPSQIIEWTKQYKECLTILPPASVEYRVSGNMAHALRSCKDIVTNLYKTIYT